MHPDFFVATQEKQIPIRHPDSGVSPAVSAWSRIGRPSLAADVPDEENVTSPSTESGSTAGMIGAKASLCNGWLMASSAWTRATSSMRAAGPQTNTSASDNPGIPSRWSALKCPSSRVW